MDGFNVDVGGFMDQFVGFASNKGEFEKANNVKYGETGIKSNTEIHVSGSTSLDNGIDVSFKVELEGDTKNAGNDEAYLTVSGDFGKIELGNNDGASNQLHVGAPSVGALGAVDTGAGDFIKSNFQGTTAVNASGSGDNSKVTYVSPSFEGFQIGASYTPNAGSEAAGGGTTQVDLEDKISNIISLGAAYSVDMDGASVSAAVGYEMGNAVKVAAGTDKPDSYDWLSAGLNVSMSGFTIGAEYGVRKGNDNEKNDDKSTTYAVGVSYAMDDASVSLGWQTAEFETDLTAAQIATGGSATASTTTNGYKFDEADKFNYFELGASYKLGTGVDWKSSLGYMTTKNSNAKSEYNKNKSKNEGYVLATGLSLSF